MGRPLAGPVRIGKSPIWFARLTVKPSDRPKAGCNRLTKSLGTSDREEALRRWPEALDQLRRELEIRLGVPVTDHAEIRARVEAEFGKYQLAADVVTFPRLPIKPDYKHNPDAGTYKPTLKIEADSHDQAKAILNVEELDFTSDLHNQVLDTIEDGKPFISWEDVLENYLARSLKRRGRPIAKGTISKAHTSINMFRQFCPYPGQINRQHVEDFARWLEVEKKQKPSAVQTKCQMLQALISVTIKTNNFLDDLQINPFTLVDYKGAINEEDRIRAFDIKTELVTVLKGEWSGVFRALAGSSMRIGELTNRDLEKDIDGNMVIIRDYLPNKWKPKSQSSYRRIPMDDKAIQAMLSVYDLGVRPRTIGERLNEYVNDTFPGDSTLRVHSTRHTFKTLTRLVGMPADISDEISGHAKQTVSRVSDCYGLYPDDVLIKNNQMVWDYLDSLIE